MDAQKTCKLKKPHYQTIYTRRAGSVSLCGGQNIRIETMDFIEWCEWELICTCINKGWNGIGALDRFHSIFHHGNWRAKVSVMWILTNQQAAL